MAALTPRSYTITPVDTPTFTLHYGQKDISREVTPYVLSVSFTDRLAGESDEIEVELEDSDGRWREAWYPGKGDSLTLAIGLAGQPLLACGTFSLDELEFSSPPDSVRLRGLSAPVTRALRTRSNRAFEATTLRAIASRIAKKHHLRLEGSLAPLELDRVTQYNETDLAFITRLGREYGYIVKVTDKALVFSHRATLREASPLLTLTPSDVSRFTLRDTLNRIYQQGKVKYQDTRIKKLVTVGVLADGSIGTVAEETVPAKGGRATSADTLQMQNRAHTRDEAVGKLCAGLNRHNEYQRSANLSLPGQTRLKAGITVQLADFGRLSGVWLITSVRHDLNRQSGYTCELELGQGPIANAHKKGKASKPQSLMVIGKKADGSIGVVATETPRYTGEKTMSGIKFTTGTVSAVDEKTGRVRVRLPELDNLRTAWLEVLQRNTQNNKDYWLPDIGEQVKLLLDPYGDDGVVLGAVYSQVDRPAIASRDKRRVDFADGTFVEYDRKTHVMAVGGTLQTLILTTQDTVHIQTQNATVKASKQLILDSPDTLSTDNLTVQKRLTYQGGLSGDGGANINGSLAIKEGIQTSEDIRTAHTLVDNHVHGNGNNGSPTGTPI